MWLQHRFPNVGLPLDSGPGSNGIVNNDQHISYLCPSGSSFTVSGPPAINGFVRGNDLL